MANVSLRDLVKIYPSLGKSPSFTAVKGINLEIRDEEFMVLVGPSGCGKSTTLRMIAGLEEVSDGEIAIEGRAVNEVQPKDRDIAMVFQNYALYPHMSVFDNMAFGLKLQKRPKDEIKERVEVAAEILGITSMLERKPKALSGGQRQRVAVGRAIVRNPKVFLFDEPLSNLDAKMRVSMRAEITKLHRQLKATMIYVTHDQVEAMTMGDRICVMKDGLIMQVAEPLELYDHPDNLFVAGFIGSPPMNFLEGEVVEGDGHGLAFIFNRGRSRIELNQDLSKRGRPYLGKPIILGVRPENIHVDESGSSSVALPLETSELMGAETFLYLEIDSKTIVAKVDSSHQLGTETLVPLTFDLNKAHLFDPDTELVIR